MILSVHLNQPSENAHNKDDYVLLIKLNDYFLDNNIDIKHMYGKDKELHSNNAFYLKKINTYSSHH
jgi:hypothetical protein